MFQLESSSVTVPVKSVPVFPFQEMWCCVYHFGLFSAAINTWYCGRSNDALICGWRIGSREECRIRGSWRFPSKFCDCKELQPTVRYRKCAPLHHVPCTQCNLTNCPFTPYSKDFMDRVVSATRAGDPTANTPALSLHENLLFTF